MAKFKDRQQGTRARKAIVLPLPGAVFNDETGQWEGPSDTLDVRAIRPDEHTEIVANARKFAIENGLEDPRDGDELYERGRWLHTLAIACVDHDAAADDPNPPKYFASWREIHESSDLSPELVSYLFQAQRLWQDGVSPLRKDLTEGEYVAALAQASRGDFDFFLSMRPATQLSFVRTLADRLSTLIRDLSPSSSLSEDSTRTP